jgi:2-dehydropantoate 2-reductase
MALSFGIIGAGALGGYYGARLHHAGFETHFVFHNDYAHVKNHGLRVDSIEGDFSIAAPHAWSHIENLPPCDVLCVCLKSTENHLLRDQIAHKVKPGGAVLVLQNGLGIEEELAQWVHPIPVFGGLCFLCSNKVGPGHISHLDYGGMRLGSLESNPPHSLELLSRIAEAFRLAGIDATITDNLAEARWQKLVWNIPFNGLCVILRCTTTQIMQHPAGLALATALMNEVKQASHACHTPVPAGFVEKMLADTLRMTPYLPSMRLDFDRGNPMEIDAIYSQPLARAESFGFAMPLTRMLRDQLLVAQALHNHSKGHHL